MSTNQVASSVWLAGKWKAIWVKSKDDQKFFIFFLPRFQMFFFSLTFSNIWKGTVRPDQIGLKVVPLDWSRLGRPCMFWIFILFKCWTFYRSFKFLAAFYKSQSNPFFYEGRHVSDCAVNYAQTYLFSTSRSQKMREAYILCTVCSEDGVKYSMLIVTLYLLNSLSPLTQSKGIIFRVDSTCGEGIASFNLPFSQPGISFSCKISRFWVLTKGLVHAKKWERKIYFFLHVQLSSP